MAEVDKIDKNKKRKHIRLAVVICCAFALCFFFAVEVYARKSATTETNVVDVVDYEEADTIRLMAQNGDLIYECETKNNVQYYVEDGVINVFVPQMADSCFE